MRKIKLQRWSLWRGLVELHRQSNSQMNWSPIMEMCVQYLFWKLVNFHWDFKSRTRPKVLFWWYKCMAKFTYIRSIRGLFIPNVSQNQLSNLMPWFEGAYFFSPKLIFGPLWRDRHFHSLKLHHLDSEKNPCCSSVVYFDQRLGAAHHKRWSKSSIFTFL